MHALPTRAARLSILLGFVALAALLVALPHGEMAPMGEMRFDPVTEAHVFVHDHGRMVMHGFANMTGQLALALTLASLALPYLKRAWATRLHRRLGIPILALAGIHTLIYLADGSLRGWLPGMLSFAFFGIHGATGAWKEAFLRAWGSGWWRLAHRGSGWAALAMVVQHVLMASWHLGFASWFEARGF